jgi:hypothetical protein
MDLGVSVSWGKLIASWSFSWGKMMSPMGYPIFRQSHAVLMKQLRELVKLTFSELENHHF